MRVGLPFQVVRAPEEMRALAEDQRRDGRRVCVVPTMGFLHDGHLSLVRAGRMRSDLLVATIFVNPTQFGPAEDLNRYPRDEAGDLAKLRACGVNVAFCPSPASMYLPGYQTCVQVRELEQPLCGRSRPGHFSGVASVVAKLFHLTLPHLAVFGQKDFQQLVVIRRMVRDLDFGIEILGMPIVRESDGLAMSSRNAYLTPEERAQATCLSRALSAARSVFEAGQREAGALIAAARAVIEASPLAGIDYIELCDADDLREIIWVDRPAVLALAAYFGRTRLIDNTVLGG
jgi:pantoate--beta-alanine ligase